MGYVRIARARLRIAGLFVTIGLVLLFWGFGASSTYAQGSAIAKGATLEEQVRAGIRAMEADRSARAESLLAEVVRARSSYISPQRGAAAYWLGTAYARQEETEHAHEAWIAGQRAVTAADAFDVRLADAYLRALFATDLAARRSKAADVYLRLLSHADSSLAAPEAAIVRRHVAQSALLMKEEKRARLSDGSLHDESWTLKDGAGKYLVAWWQRQDRAPATPENERLEEHMQRVAEADAKYVYEERVSGLDDRGETLVRYGEPYKQRSIRYNDAGFFRDVFRFGVHVSGFDFPKNEIWTYPQIHHAAYFVFVERNGLFEIGESADLLPRRLRNVYNTSERHLNRAVSALAAMRYIFRDLALYHPDFGTLYNEVENYASWQEMNAKTYEITGQAPPGTTVREVGAGIGQRRFVFAAPSMGIDLPSRFVQRTAMQQKTVDYHAKRARQQSMPQQHSGLFDEVDSLSLAVRTARFMEPDGKTRTEVYWGTHSRHLRPQEREENAGPEGTLVKLTAVQYDRNYERRRTTDKWYNAGGALQNEGLVVPGVFSVRSTADPYHLALQWEQYAAEGVEKGHRGMQLGKQLRVATRRLDTLATLNTSARALEMSDLRPMFPAGTSAEAAGGAMGQAAAPYPFDTIAPDASLLLYFELYHLGFGSDDRTRYTVEYEVQRRTERGGLARLFRGDEEQRTTARTTYEGQSRTAKERILIDLSEWQDKGAGELTVAVRVTDETTGQRVERSISFEVVEPANS